MSRPRRVGSASQRESSNSTSASAARSATGGTLPDGRVYTYQAVYQDIVRPRRILYTYEMHLDDSRISISLATAEFAPEHDGTRLLFTEQGAFLDGHEAPARRDEGMGSLLDALGMELQSEQAATRTADAPPRGGDGSA
jgi:uncharacterized protein YndB with AHSA1/START domain